MAPTTLTGGSGSGISTRRNNNRLRRNYTSVATNQDDDDDDDDDDQDDDGVGDVDDVDDVDVDDDDDNINDDEFQDEPDNKTTGVVAVAVPDNNNKEEEEEEDEITTLIVTILDSSHKKFNIPCNSTWTIGKFKYKSSLIHKCPSKQQRLIFRGKMLTNDNQTLLENKINSSNIIIHLFPKPRVVVTNSKDNSNNNNANKYTGDNNDNGDNNNDNDNDGNDGPSGNGGGGGGGGGGGAHIPSIIIDQDEQDRRGQILVLGSVEIAESQNNVKMLSLLLVMICSMRLLALFSIAMGTSSSIVVNNNNENGTGSNGTLTHNHTNDIPHNNIYDNDFVDDTVLRENNSDYGQGTVRPWENSDYYDLLVSGVGFYVGTLGLKATQENTLKLATMYAVGTIVSGILWNVWNVFEYIHFFQEQTEYRNDHHNNDDHEESNDTSYNNNNNNNNKNSQADYQNGGGNDDLPPLTRDDFVTVAFFTILMPLGVWFLCCIRAFEFRRLISEAEEEATERIRNEYTERETDTDNDNDGRNGNGNGNGDYGDGNNSITEIV